MKKAYIQVMTSFIFVVVLVVAALLLLYLVNLNTLMELISGESLRSYEEAQFKKEQLVSCYANPQGLIPLAHLTDVECNVQDYRIEIIEDSDSCAPGVLEQNGSDYGKNLIVFSQSFLNGTISCLGIITVFS
jgi:hypothetical protein